MSKICQITGKKAMIGNNVSHSKRRTKRTFDVNLFTKKFYYVEQDCWISLNICANGLRVINKKGLDAALNEAVTKPWQRKQSQPFRQVKKDVLILRLSRWLNLRKQELTSSMSKWYLTKKFKTFSRNNSVGMTGRKFLSYIMEGTFFIPQCYHHNTL